MGIQDLPTLNYTSEELRKVIYQNEDSVIRKWLKPPYCIDGWRFDVADVFARNDEVQLAYEIWPKLRESIRGENPDAYILAEDWGDCAGYLQGEEWDSPMNYYGCGRVIRQFVGEPDLFNGRNEYLREVNYKMTAKDVKNRVMEHLAKLPFVIWQNQFNLFDSHDVSRLHNSEAVHPEEYRGAVMFLFIMIGAPSIFYGDEAAVGKGCEDREECRFTMPWDTGFEKKEMYRLYRTLAHLKLEKKAFSKGGMKFLYAQGQIIAIARFYEQEAYILVMSTDDTEREIILPLASIGASGFVGREDLFGEPVDTKRLNAREIRMKVKAHQSYLMECV